MHQPITIAKVREDMTVKVKAGDWIILVQPNKPFGDHHAARTALAAEWPASKKYSVVACGRMDNKYSDLVFTTEEELKAEEERRVKWEADQAKAPAQAEDRSKRIQDEALAKEAEEHKKRVAAASKVNDEIRNRELPRV